MDGKLHMDYRRSICYQWMMKRIIQMDDGRNSGMDGWQKEPIDDERNSLNG